MFSSTKFTDDNFVDIELLTKVKCNFTFDDPIMN